MKGLNRNSIPDLVEVTLRVTKSNEFDHSELRVEMRAHQVVLAAQDSFEFTVQLNRANLVLDLDGLEVVPRSRLGEPVKPLSLPVEYKLTQEKGRSGEVAGGIDIGVSAHPNISLQGKASGSASSKVTSSATIEQTHAMQSVKARGNLTWEVTDQTIDGSLAPLSATYLNDDVLCKVTASPGANMSAVKLSTFARQRDLRMTPNSAARKLLYKSKNHERMIQALLAKALQHSPANGGVITFCISEVVVEDS